MYDITADTLEWAYKKLKCYYYYAKGNESNYIKEKIIAFEKKLDKGETSFGDMADLLNKQVNPYNYVNLKWSVDYVVYPKKNAFSQGYGDIITKKYNAFIDMPLEYYLVDVLFCLNIIESLDGQSTVFAFIPSSKFNNTNDSLHNKYLFNYYINDYKKWTHIPNNSYLKDPYSPRVVVKMDLKECFYHVSFNFKKVIEHLSIKNNVSLIMGSVYRYYSSLVLKDKYSEGKEPDYSILPVGLISSFVLLNYLLSDFDKNIHSNKDVISYGRYVDDIIIVLKADKALTYDEIVKNYFANDIVCEKKLYSIKASGRLHDDLPINESKVSIKFWDKNTHPDIDFYDFRCASFIDELEIPELEDEKIKIDDSDIKHTRSIIRNYNPQDYTKIKKAFLSLTGCDLLNSYSLWMDIFRIVDENNDVETHETIKERIDTSLKLIECFTDEECDKKMTEKLREQLTYELDFSLKYCTCKSSESAYMFNITSEDVYKLLYDAIENNSDRLPFNASIIDISLYYSRHRKCLNPDILTFVMEQYKKLNGLKNIDNFDIAACKLSEKEELIKLQTGGKSNKKVKICIACIPMQYFDGDDAKQQYSDNFGKLSKLSCFDIDRIIEEASKYKCDYIIFPEYAIGMDDIRQTINRCRQKHISLIAGIDHFAEDNYVYNFCCIFDKNTNLVFLKPKNYMPLKEKIIIKNVVKEPFEPEKKKYLVIEDGNFIHSTMTCYEATNIIDRAKLAGKINCLFMPVHNKDTKYFSNIVESISRDLSTYVVQANCNGYGDSRIRMPAKDVSADIVRTKGGDNLHCIIAELDLEKLVECNDEYLNALENIVEYKRKDIKPLSAGNVHCKINSSNIFKSNM